MRYDHSQINSDDGVESFSMRTDRSPSTGQAHQPSARSAACELRLVRQRPLLARRLLAHGVESQVKAVRARRAVQAADGVPVTGIRSDRAKPHQPTLPVLAK
jgi:hypothetical protein